jgi:hypothetical protein
LRQGMTIETKCSLVLAVGFSASICWVISGYRGGS